MGVITAMEVVFAGSVSREFSVNLIDKGIEVSERSVHRSTDAGCGSYEFHEWLQGQLNGEASGAVEYVSQDTYNIGEIVWQNGQYFKSTKNGNSSDPVTLEDWILVPKFTDSNLEDFWVNYVRPWLANGIISKVIGISTFSISKKGVTAWADERTNQRTASQAEIRLVKEELWQICVDHYKEMISRAWELHALEVVDFSDSGLPARSTPISDRDSSNRIGFRY